jgi:hypothetical protein
MHSTIREEIYTPMATLQLCQTSGSAKELLFQSPHRARFYFALLAYGVDFAGAQGTMIFDQQSSDESNPGAGFNTIQNVQPTGQSFTPSLSAIGFVRFNLFDRGPNNGIGATLLVNLRNDSISGPIIDSTAPVALPDGPGGFSFVDFFFSSNVPLQPGTKYYLQPVVQSGDLWGIVGDRFNYPGGELYALGVGTPLTDYWFQEGVIVPEPSSSALLLSAAGLWARSRHARK